jgi:hypothetical protein
MKDWLAATLFRRLGAFAARIALTIGILALTAATSAAATGYRATVSGGCPPTISVPPLTDPNPSLTPVAISGGSEASGGSVRAASALRAEVHTSAPPTNAFNGLPGDCSVSATVTFDDIVIQGPAGFVHVRLHLPFHANITHESTRMSDGTNNVHSGAAGQVSFNATFGVARALFQVQLNSETDPRESVTALGNGAEFVPKPRIAGLINLDPSGFVTLFFQNSTPVTGTLGVPFAGFQTYAIDEARGEIILSTDVPANSNLQLSLNVNQSVNVGSFFIMSAFAEIAQTGLGFPVDGAPVFELPDGYTAQVPSAGVIDNVVPQVFKCAQTVASWRNHPTDWPLTIMTLGAQTYNQDELLGILRMQPTALRPDASVVLAQQLVAARLNEANDAAPGPMLVPSMVADTLLAGFGGKLPYRVLPTTVVGQQMTNTALQLSRYNGGLLAPVCVP